MGWAWGMQPSEIERLSISKLLIYEAQAVRIGKELKQAQGG